MNGQDARPVWLTEDEAKKYGVVTWDRWEAAPADAAEAIDRVMEHLPCPVDWDPTDAVLRALNFPEDSA